MAEICSRLKTAAAQDNGWDVVLLQEVWVESDRKNLQKCGYPFSADVEDYSQPLDTGLIILSKHKILETSRLTYPALPKINLSEEDGESFARKSAMIVRIDHPKAGPIWVANTHLVSQYSKVNDVYQTARKQQFSRFVEWSRYQAGKEPLLIGGDWNFGPKMPLWPLIAELVPDFSQGPQSENSCTICPPNTMHTENEGKVDHLFGSRHWKVEKANQAMVEPLVLPDLKMSVSDHFGWETQFTLISKD